VQCDNVPRGVICEVESVNENSLSLNGHHARPITESVELCFLDEDIEYLSLEDGESQVESNSSCDNPSIDEQVVELNCENVCYEQFDSELHAVLPSCIKNDLKKGRDNLFDTNFISPSFTMNDFKKGDGVSFGMLMSPREACISGSLFSFFRMEESPKIRPKTYFVKNGDIYNLHLRSYIPPIIKDAKFISRGYVAFHQVYITQW
jgi:hypothetical protein